MGGVGGELENAGVPLGKEIRQSIDLTNEEQNKWEHVKHELSCYFLTQNKLIQNEKQPSRGAPQKKGLQVCVLQYNSLVSVFKILEFILNKVAVSQPPTLPKVALLHG